MLPPYSLPVVEKSSKVGKVVPKQSKIPIFLGDATFLLAVNPFSTTPSNSATGSDKSQQFRRMGIDPPISAEPISF
jgi:hypothetical protein